MTRQIVGSLEEDDGIDVEVKCPLTEMIEGLLEVESGVTCGETGDEDVEMGRIGFAMMVHLEVDSDAFFGDEVDPSDVVGACH